MGRKVTTVKIKEKINQQFSKDRPDIIRRIKTRQAVWFGHVTRMEQTRLPRIAMYEEIPHQNKQGRSCQKRIDNILETVNLSKEAASALAQ